MSITRRGFLTGMLALGAAPAIVRAASLMPIWVPPQELMIGRYEGFNFYKTVAIPDDYYTIMHPSAEQAMRELMLTGSAKVIYRREVLRHGS
jgi:hypothetical protein